MNIASILRPRVLVVFALALVLSVSAYGFAAANDVAKSGAGDGATAISGYDITNVAYTLDTGTPTKITSVAFDIAPHISGGAAAGSAKIKLFDAETAYHTCVVSSGAATCSIGSGGVLTSLADNLSVVATSN
jgi:hypothetical protein